MRREADEVRTAADQNAERRVEVPRLLDAGRKQQPGCQQNDADLDDEARSPASMRRPTIGLKAAETRKPKEKAPAASPRSHPNSLTSGGSSSEKAVRAVTPSPS